MAAFERPLPVVDGLDPEAGLAAVGGRLSIYRRLLGRFIELHASDPDRWRERLQTGARAEAAAMVHQLHGAAATLGLVVVADAAQALTVALRAGAGESAVATLSDQLAQTLLDGMVALRAGLALGEQDPGPGAGLD